MIEQDLITGVRFMGAASMIVIALIVAIVNRGKDRSTIYEHSRWFIFAATMLLGIHNLIQFFGHFREENTTLCWAINLVFYVVLTPLYNMGELNLLRAGRNMKAQIIRNATFVGICYILLAVGLATDTLINNERPWMTTTFIVATCFFLKLIELSLTLHKEMKLAATRLTDDELDEPHQALRYTAKSMNWIIILSLATPWVGMSSSILLNSIFGIAIFGMLLWFIIKFSLLGYNMAQLIEMTDEIYEASIIEEENETAINNTAESLDQDFIRIRQWVDSRSYLDANITMKEALEQMGISATVLNEYLKRNTNVKGYRQWLPYLRLKEARRILRTQPGISLQTLAEKCGYSSNSNFTRAFKAQEGLTPSALLGQKKK